MDYVVDVAYAAGQRFLCFFNNHLFADVNGYAGSMERFFCNSFFIKGENTVSFEWKAADVKAIEVPRIEISLRRKNDISDPGVTVWKKKFDEKDCMFDHGNSSVRFIFTFDNPTGNNFYDLLYSSPVCNGTLEEFKNNQKLMRHTSYYIYTSFKNNASAGIVNISTVRIRDDANAGGESIEMLTDSYRSALFDIQQDTLAYTLKSQEQFIFLPTCGGRLWRVGVMENVESAKHIMEDVWMFPHALPNFDYELMQSKGEDGLFLMLPSYIAKAEDKFVIVR